MPGINLKQIPLRLPPSSSALAPPVIPVGQKVGSIISSEMASLLQPYECCFDRTEIAK